MSKRKKIPLEVEGDVIFKSDYKCCVCHDETKGDHIHHIDSNNSNNKFDNLALLCFRHHDDASKKSSLSKRLTPNAIKKFRNEWYEIIEERTRRLKGTYDIPVEQLSSEDLFRASLDANIIIQIINIREKYFDTNWKKRGKLLSKLYPFGEYSSFRISYEVLLFLSHALSQLRADMPLEILSSLTSLVHTFHVRGEEDNKRIAANTTIKIAENIIYDATIYAKDLEMVAYGCNILKMVYQNANTESKKPLHIKVRKVYEKLKIDFQKENNDKCKNAIETMEVFEDDLENWGTAWPLFPEHLKKEII